MESVTVLWPVRVWVSVQGFHVNVQGWEWETPVTGGQMLGLAHGISECPRLCARTGARSPPPWPQFPMVAPPSVDGGYAGHLASCLAAPQHGGHHRFTRGIRFNWKAGAPLGWGIPGRGPPRGSSWSGVGVGESPKAPSTVTPAGDRSVSGCWLSSCLRAPCCPEGLRRFWLRSQQNLKMMPVATRTMMMDMVIVT